MSDEQKGPRWITASESFRDFNSIATETVQVDPKGEDNGDMSNPFLTMQGAIDAFELLDPLPSNPIILIGGNAVGGFTTLLPYLTIVGENGLETDGSQRTASAITGDITMTAEDGPEAGTVVLIIKNCWSNKSVTFEGSASNQELNLINSVFVGGVVSFFTTLGNAVIHGTYMGGSGSAFSRVHNVSIKGGVDAILNLTDVWVDNGISAIDSTNLVLTRAVVTNIASSINDVSKTDSFIMGTNSASGATTTSDVLFNPENYDFSTLPTSLPSEVGKAWIDTTGGFNIVKVKL